MNWANALSERLPTTPAIHWLDEDRLNLTVDDETLKYSVHHKAFLAVAGRAIKRGQDLGLFYPCIADADLTLLVAYCYALWTDVRFHMSVPGRWLNRRTADSNADLLIIGNAPALRSLLDKRSKISGQSLESYLSLAWPARRNCKDSSGSLVVKGSGREMRAIIVPKSHLSENGIEKFQRLCAPFAILYDLTCSANVSGDLIAEYNILRAAFPTVPVIFLGALGDMPVVKMLRDESRVSLWIERAHDARLIEEDSGPSANGSAIGLDLHSRRVASNTRIEVEIVQDEYFDSSLGELLSIVGKLEQAATSDDRGVVRLGRSILRELSALSVPLAMQEELHRLEKRRGAYTTQLLRNRIDDIRSESGSVGKVTELLGVLGDRATKLSEVLIKPNALSGKAVALLDWIQKGIDAGEALIVVCPNESVRRTMLAYLSSRHIDTITRPIEVVTRSALWRRARFGSLPTKLSVFWIGAPDFYSGKYFAGILPKVTMAAYPVEQEAFGEQINFFAHSSQFLSELSGDKLSFLMDSGVVLNDKATDPESGPLWELVWRDRQVAGIYPAELPPIPDFELPKSDWITNWLDEPETPPKDIRPKPEEPSVVISLSDDEADVVLPLDREVLVLDEISASSDGLVTVSALRAGMTILVPRDAPSLPLIDRLIDNLRSEPQYLLNERLAERWYLAVERIAAKTNRDYERALYLLRDHGVDVVTPQAVNNWFNHKVIGPQTIKSLKAVAEAAEMPDIVSNINPIWGAIRFVREARRNLGRQIAAYIRAGLSVHADMLISRELGLYGADLEDLTRVGEITRISAL